MAINCAKCEKTLDSTSFSRDYKRVPQIASQLNAKDEKNSHDFIV